jgi:tRNA dimethylallyltransferase
MQAADVILIAGPTASGKSRVALELAARTGATIINADSMQVYRELRLITARPTAEDEAAVPHRLYGHVAAATRYSVGQWLREAAAALKEARAAGRGAIVVGGTGLYFKALTEGLAEVPPIPEEVRAAVREDARRLPPQALHDRLAAIDPEGARSVRVSDKARLVRALEVIEATGRTLGDWQRRQPTLAVVEAPAARIVLAPPMPLLHRRISERAERMAAEGAMAEAAALAALGLEAELPAMKAIGAREFLAHVAGDTSLVEAIAAVKTETRRYAKRQMTWFRNQMADWRFVEEPASLDLAVPAA